MTTILKITDNSHIEWNPYRENHDSSPYITKMIKFPTKRENNSNSYRDYCHGFPHRDSFQYGSHR